jgi:hypothetical protein
MKFRSIYPWQAIDDIAEGKKVNVLDKKTKTVFLVNELSVETALRMTESKESGRFEFWYAEEDEGDGKF